MLRRRSGVPSATSGEGKRASGDTRIFRDRPKLGYLSGGPHNEDYNILGSILGLGPPEGICVWEGSKSVIPLREAHRDI